MSGGGGKGGESTQKVEIDPRLEKEALKNMKQARAVSQLPYAPNFGAQVAAFTPQQQAAFDTANMAAGAFGLPTAKTNPLPEAQNVGGFQGYSTKGLYEDAMSKVPSGVLALYNALFANPNAPAGAKVAAGATNRGVKGSSSGKGGLFG